MWSLSLLLLAAILAAALRETIPSLRLYFWVEFWATAVGLAGLPLYHLWPDAYTLLFILTELAVFFAFWNAVQHLATDIGFLICFVFWLGMAYFALRGAENVSFGTVATLGEAVIRCSLAMALGFAAPNSERRLTYVTLVILWLLLGIYDFGDVLYPDSHTWGKFGEFVPQLLCIAGFGFIAIRGDHARIRTENRQAV
jgi:hypothetical protein